MKATCNTCKFFQEIKFKGGECRFESPKGSTGGWPPTQRDEWCGRFEQKDSTATGVAVEVTLV